MPHRSVARLTLALLVLLARSRRPRRRSTRCRRQPVREHAGARGEIYVYGMRNPYRWSFDRQTGDMWIGDVGGTQEEITHLPRAQIAGANLGWNCRSGTRSQSRLHARELLRAGPHLPERHRTW